MKGKYIERVGRFLSVLWIFFFKQKTAYEIGTGDWSSDVCSSDLTVVTALLSIAAFFLPVKHASRFQYALYSVSNCKKI